MNTEPMGQEGGVVNAARLRHRLAELWPPLDRREFWAIQAMVLLVAALHSAVESQHLLGDESPLYLVPTSLYLIPVVYAAVTFGLRGAALTTLWAVVLVVINVVFWHEGLHRAGELLQVAWIGATGMFVGYRVDRERETRTRAEAHEAALRASRERYQDIVDNITEPIVIVSDDDHIVQANRAAMALLFDGRDLVGEMQLAPRIARQAAAPLEGELRSDADPPAVSLGDPPRRYELVVTTAGDGGSGRQILFRDITSSYEREQGLEVVAREALAAREAEQQRIARDLHDGPLQSVIQLWRDLDELEPSAPAESRASVRAARETAELVAAELRGFSRDLRPSVLDDLGISAAIRAEAESLEQRADLRVQVRVTGRSQRLEEDVELALLRITQEAVRNIEQHAGAANVVIDIAFTDEAVELRIADDGRGLERKLAMSELLSRNHLGLIGMRERARFVGGNVQLLETAGGGLTVVVSVPVYELPHR